MNAAVLPHDHGDIRDVEVYRKLLSETTGFDTVTYMLEQLADGTRIRIFWMLCHYESCVTNISIVMGMSCPAISHHLRCLKESGLIEGERRGKEVYYKAIDSPEVEFLHHMIEELMSLRCPKE